MITGWNGPDEALRIVHIEGIQRQDDNSPVKNIMCVTKIGLLYLSRRHIEPLTLSSNPKSSTEV